MSEEGFEDRRKSGEQRAQVRNLEEISGKTLESPGADARTERLRAQFRSARGEGSRMSMTQRFLIGITIFLLIVMFGAGGQIIAALAPKLPPGVNAPD